MSYINTSAKIDHKKLKKIKYKVNPNCCFCKFGRFMNYTFGECMKFDTPIYANGSCPSFVKDEFYFPLSMEYGRYRDFF